jgi:hypothetical protein
VNGPIGTVLQDTATLTGSAGATGSIEFKLYATADCSGPPVDDETVPVTGDGSYATTAGYTADATGTYQWTASYSGDTNNNPAASGCGAEQVVIDSSPSLYWADGTGNIVADPVTGVTGGARPRWPAARTTRLTWRWTMAPCTGPTAVPARSWRSE